MDNLEKPHVLNFTQLGRVLVVLLVLTAIIVGVSFVHLEFLNISIAATKVIFVLLFFVQLKYQGWIINISFLNTAGVLAILIGFTFWEVAHTDNIWRIL